jgi:hypothetical protein
MRSTFKLRGPVLGGLLALAAAVGLPAGAQAEGDGSGAGRGAEQRCARQFEQVIRQDMESFANYDVEGWRAVHDPRAVTVFADGRVTHGFEATLAALSGHFSGREATWEYTELTRRVDGCRTGWILYDTTYSLPSVNFRQRAVVGVTYTYRHGRWLVVADQNTLVRTPAA